MLDHKEIPDNQTANADVKHTKAPGFKVYSRELTDALGLTSHLGVSMFVCIFLGLLVGKTLDRRLDTAPWMLIICMVLGAGAAFKTAYDILIRKWMK